MCLLCMVCVCVCVCVWGKDVWLHLVEGGGKKQRKGLVYDDDRVSLEWILVPPCSPLYQNGGCGPAGDADGGELAMDGEPAGDVSLIQVGRGAYIYFFIYVTSV